ncbi:hypothetical protein EV401DRAFT_1392383 [Pisolithus croceorrhizus]|nr:hypothetical protein EV401DRAFT_1392383 [Pisolithus croceorrhizus]
MLPGRPAQAQYVLTTESCCDPWSCMQTAKLSVSIRVPACMYWLRESHRSEKYETERCRMAVLILRGQHTSCSFGVEPPCSPEIFRCIPPRSGCGKGQTVFVSWSCVHHGALRGPSVERDIDAQFLSRAFTVNVGNTRCRRSSFMMTRMLSGGASDAIPVSRCCSSPARRSLDGSPPVPLRPCVWRKALKMVAVSLSPGLATFYKITVYFSRTRLETLN